MKYKVIAKNKIDFESIKFLTSNSNRVVESNENQVCMVIDSLNQSEIRYLTALGLTIQEVKEPVKPIRQVKTTKPKESITSGIHWVEPVVVLAIILTIVGVIFFNVANR